MGTSVHRPALPREVVFHIYDVLSPEASCSLACVSKGMAASMRAYKEDLLGKLASCFNEGLLSNDQIAHILTNHIEKNEELKQRFIEGLVVRMKKETFLFVSPESPVIPYLRKKFATLDFNDLLQNLDITSHLYKTLFKSPLPTDNEDSKRTAIKHVQAIWPSDMVYFFKDAPFKQKGVRKFFQQKKEKILKELSNESSHYPYFSFLSLDADFEKLQDEAHNIIVTDAQLQINSIKNKLEELFRVNSEHKLILSIGDSRFVRNGRLNLKSDNLPPSVKHLCVMNASSVVTSIGDNFLYYCPGLTSFDTSGLTQVKSIGKGFLGECNSLTSFDTSGLKQVTSIGHSFLFGCTGLTSFDTSGLTQVTSIGDAFLQVCKSLTSFDTSGLTQVTSIKDGFLCGCTGLTSFDTSRLTQVTSIGDYFLSGCNSLTSFDASGLTQVTSIGGKFLFGCTGLTSFDTSRLTQVTSIGSCFLNWGYSLTSFDTSGLTQVTSIGVNFLYGCNNLTSFDTSGLKQVTSVGDGFLSDCTGLDAEDITLALKCLRS